MTPLVQSTQVQRPILNI